MSARTVKLMEDARVELEAVLNDSDLLNEDQTDEVITVLIEYAADVITALGPLADLGEEEE